MGKGTIKLETNRLVLRKFKDQDYQSMFDNWASDAEVAKNAGWPKHESAEDTKGLVEMWVAEYKQDNTFNWIIDLDKTSIGSITVVRKDLSNRTCEIGYNIGRDYWNHGYATEAIGSVIQYLFSTGLFDTIAAQCFEFNVPSIKVLEKNHFKREGILRDRYILDNEKVNLIELSILKKEYDTCQNQK